MRVIVVNGPNLNLLGTREPEIYGRRTYSDLVDFIGVSAREIGVEADVFQSNSESEIVEAIQRSAGVYDGIVINAAAYSHTSVAILDALRAIALPCAEVHLTDTSAREEFRRFSFVSLYASKVIVGKGFEGYAEAMSFLAENARP